MTGPASWEMRLPQAPPGPPLGVAEGTWAGVRKPLPAPPPHVCQQLEEGVAAIGPVRGGGLLPDARRGLHGLAAGMGVREAKPPVSPLLSLPA